MTQIDKVDSAESMNQIVKVDSAESTSPIVKVYSAEVSFVCVLRSQVVPWRKGKREIPLSTNALPFQTYVNKVRLKGNKKKMRGWPSKVYKTTMYSSQYCKLLTTLR